MESSREQVNKKVIYRTIVLIIVSMIIFSIILFKNFFVNKASFEEKNYKNTLNLYVLNDGTLVLE